MRLTPKNLFLFYVNMVMWVCVCMGFYSSCSEQGFGCGESFWDF